MQKCAFFSIFLCWNSQIWSNFNTFVIILGENWRQNKFWGHLPPWHRHCGFWHVQWVTFLWVVWRLTQGKYATLDIYGMWHLMATVASATCGERRMSRPLYTVANKSQMKALIKLQMTLSLHVPSICNKVTNDMFPNVAEDQIIWQRVLEISVATVYKGPLIQLSPQWQMPTWHRMSYATVILSGIISLCTPYLV